MTRDEAIKVLKEYLELDKDIDSEYLEAQKVAIKALEQVPIFDKIRDEIDKARFTDKDTKVYRNVLASGLEMAMRIIDMYKEDEVMNKEQKDKLIKMLAEDKNDFIVGCNRRIAEEYGKIEGADYMLQIIMDALCGKDEEE